MSITPYCSLAEAKAAMKAERVLASADNIVLAAIRQISQRIDRMFYKRAAPFFAPFIETRDNYRVSGSRINSYDGTFYFGDPLLALSAVTVGTQVLTLATDVRLYQGEYGVFDTLQLVDRCCSSWYRYITCNGCSAAPYLTIAGTWGYNVDWSNAWLNTLQVTPIMTNSQTSFVVTDVDAANANGLTPAISAGNLLQIDTEWLYVSATDTTTNTVTVVRGVNGSTAAAHNAASLIYAYQVEEAIKRAVARQVGLQFAKIGAYDNITVQDLSDVTFAYDVLAEFKALLSIYAN